MESVPLVSHLVSQLYFAKRLSVLNPYFYWVGKNDDRVMRDKTEAYFLFSVSSIASTLGFSLYK